MQWLGYVNITRYQHKSDNDKDITILFGATMKRRAIVFALRLILSLFLSLKLLVIINKLICFIQQFNLFVILSAINFILHTFVIGNHVYTYILLFWSLCNQRKCFLNELYLLRIFLCSGVLYYLMQFSSLKKTIFCWNLFIFQQVHFFIYMYPI